VTAGPLVCVVTPVFNGRPYLSECIESVLAQTYRRLEYVIHDNCSTDGSLELARAYAARDPRITVVAAAEHLPAIESQSRAMRAVTSGSKYAKVVHADDWLFPECLEQLLVVAEAHPSVGLVGAYWVDSHGRVRRGLPPGRTIFPGHTIGRGVMLGELSVVNSLTTSMLRTDVVREADPFYDPALLAADFDACFRVLRDWDFGFVHQILSFMRRHPAQVSHNSGRLGLWLPEQIELLRRYGPAFLTERETEELGDRLAARYLSNLARRVARLRGAEYRAYHSVFVRRVIASVPPGRLTRALVEEAHAVLSRLTP
jgi:glycosyltransferase involved in cell wall biosynthesis